MFGNFERGRGKKLNSRLIFEFPHYVEELVVDSGFFLELALDLFEEIECALEFEWRLFPIRRRRLLLLLRLLGSGHGLLKRLRELRRSWLRRLGDGVFDLNRGGERSGRRSLMRMPCRSDWRRRRLLLLLLLLLWLH